MERIWQWAWDRYAARYTWAYGVVTIVLVLPTYLFLSLGVVALERCSRYVEAAGVAAVAVPVPSGRAR